MTSPRVLYLQSGGPTAVVNASAQGVIEAARHAGVSLCAARHGLTGLRQGELLDLDTVPQRQWQQLSTLPGTCFGSSREMLPPYDSAPETWHQLRAVLRGAGIGTVLLNGGNGSMTTALRLTEFGQRLGYPLRVIGIPKTIDNDLVATHFSPGYPSAAKYLAASVRELALDVSSLGPGRVMLLETMGRNAGWLAAGCAAATRHPGDAPHLLLLPEVPYQPERLLDALDTCLRQHGHAVVVVAEGVRDDNGVLLAEQPYTPGSAFQQLGGAAQRVASYLTQQRGLHVHAAVADCLQRTARHLVSALDLRLAQAAGRTALEWALQEQSGVMVGLRPAQGKEHWEMAAVALADVADAERRLPASYIGADGFSVSPDFLDYLRPLLQGEDWPPFADGLPSYPSLQWPVLRWR
ncbi:diphosphate--fructose-6-phosphate 1-phosphotransferase [Pseudogulbenkiania subflava]|uniref:Pyrophosphate--fructose 6-phosphate 1-phosphotransferase n=1 Tax=Pseudogulbenkiania subflava DSM 22618 TaxID=1123014 RepID=A0A1Y6BYZ2_9NEIS|nr:diphosphate--fructose-6-phosphate 1-phosphotransferase [Pseudogulbenkiania subflava]SMF25165.1 6-phosphofructokinase [Pseudogulbenkiania subflava DSM 22618]